MLRTLTHLVAVLIAGLALAGCGAPAASDPDPEPTDVASVPAAPTSPVAPPAPSEKSDADGVLADVVAATKQVKTGVMKTWSVTEMPGKSIPARADIVFDRSDAAHPRVHLTAEITGRSFESVLDGDTLYLRGAGKTKWAKTTVAEAGAQVAEQGSTDPSDAFSKLQGNAKRIEYVGEEDVAGVSTKHYVVVTDPSTLGYGGKLDARVDMWLNAENQPVKYEIFSELAHGTITATTELTQINEPVTITVPAADEIAG